MSCQQYMAKRVHLQQRHQGRLLEDMQFATIVVRFVLFAVCISAVEGRWRKWSKWTACDTHITTCPCGGGTQERTRTCRRGICLGLEKEVKDCFVKDCKCGYQCDVLHQDRVKCGSANKTSKECSEDEFCCFDKIRKTCYKAIPQLIPKIYDEWTSWSKCRCNTTSQFRSRQCRSALLTDGGLRPDQSQDTLLEKDSAKTSLLGQKIKKKVGSWYNYLSSLYHRKKSGDIELKKDDADNGFDIERRGWGWGWMRITGRNCRPEEEKRPCKTVKRCKKRKRQ